MAKGQKLWKF